VFDSWNQWTWVTVAWLQLVVAYGGYLAYLAWRRRQLLRDESAHRTLDRVQRAPEVAGHSSAEAARRGPAGGRGGPGRPAAGGRP
jgi:hypothetical protein